jgi:hypothetical protein
MATMANRVKNKALREKLQRRAEFRQRFCQTGEKFQEGALPKAGKPFTAVVMAAGWAN